MGEDEARAERPRRCVRWLVRIHVLLFLAWALPDSTFANFVGMPRLLRANETYVRSSPIRYYVRNLGFYGPYYAFAPNPRTRDFWFDARIEFADGSERNVPIRRISTLPYVQK